MKALTELTSETILAEEVFTEVFGETDVILQARMLLELQERAKALGVKQKFDALVKAYQKVIKESEKSDKVRGVIDGYTDFTFPADSTLENMRCGSWVANDNGISAPISNPPYEILACYNPIIPVKRLQNIETGEEQVVLAYKRNHRWKELKIPSNVISSANKIVELSRFGIQVNSETAKHLVKYLSDVSAFNDENIEIQQSSSKLGWHDGTFLPYDCDLVFDGDIRFKNIFEAIHEQGLYENWLSITKEVRSANRIESKFMLASSFASILVQLIGTLPFFVDLWGMTEGGKSVTLMLACSVWANPDESQYIGDFKTTDVALEARADVLNNLPMLLDDTSKTSARIRDNFEGIVYDLCSGKGKSRSNKELGMNRENRWKCCFLTNGERPLNSYVNQGGAINRILEIEAGEHIYDNPQKVASILKSNYGFAGREFVEVIKTVGIETIKDIYRGFCNDLLDTDKMQKQAMSVAVVLTADYLTEEYIFKDGITISMEEAKSVLVDKAEVSDNERCYEYMIDKINMNTNRFDDTANIEKWGTIENDYAVFYPQAFTDLCEKGGFSKNSFLSWADKNNLIKTQNGRKTVVKKIDGKSIRCIYLKADQTTEDFVLVDDSEQEELPFK